ncbi:MAG: hypothetical protein AB7E12_02365 [Burkholderiaceae bacterium]|jgi:hypothetical protein
MRLFNLFLRRAGVQGLPVRGQTAVSRLTIECPREVLPELRRRIYHEFDGRGLQVASLSIDHAQARHMARACITIRYNPNERRALVSQARQLGQIPGVQSVHWGTRAAVRPAAVALN